MVFAHAQEERVTDVRLLSQDRRHAVLVNVEAHGQVMEPQAADEVTQGVSTRLLRSPTPVTPRRGVSGVEPPGWRESLTGMGTPRSRTDPLLGVLVVGALIAGCGATDRAVTGAPAEPAVYAGTGLVLEKARHGPQLCLGGIADSSPPQCAGVPLRGWDWEGVAGQASANGVTWGEYRVVGQYDGMSMTVTEPPAAPPDPSDQAQDDPFSTPCPTPDGGWQVRDPSRIGEQARQAVQELARAAPDHAGLWVDQPAPSDEPDQQPPPPEQVVLNVAFTGEPAGHEADLRQVWGGPLCVSQLPRTVAELSAIQDELRTGVAKQLGLEQLFSSTHESRSVVELGVVAATQDQLHELDQRYGDAVEVTAALQPVTPSG